MLRVCSVPVSDPSQSYSFKLDLQKKQITVLNVPTFNPQRQTAGNTVSSKTFTFDAAFGPDSTQVRDTALLFLSYDVKTDLSLSGAHLSHNIQTSATLSDLVT